MCSVDLSTGQALSQAVYQIVWCGSRFCPSVSSAVVFVCGFCR